MISSQLEPIDVIERTLRSVIDEVLSDTFGPDWTQDDKASLGSDWAQGLADKAREDQAIQAPNVVYDVPLAYAEFRDLGRLLRKHQHLFEPIFTDWEVTMAHYRVAEKLRNTIQHNRDISPTQQSLLVGIAGEMRDAVNLWRIGTPLRTKRTVLQFQGGISLQKKSEAQILEEAAAYVAQWRGRILAAIQASSLDPNRASKVVDEEFKYSIRVQHIEAAIKTLASPTPASAVGDTLYFHGEVKYRPAFRYLDAFLGAIERPYYVIAYELVDNLDVAALEKWSAKRAGLSPSSSQGSNEGLESIHYNQSIYSSMYRGHLRIGAQKFVDRTDDSGGRLSAQLDPPAVFWNAHELIGPEQLMAFIVGDITPKAMMHLVQMSLHPRD